MTANRSAPRYLAVTSSLRVYGSEFSKRCIADFSSSEKAFMMSAMLKIIPIQVVDVSSSKYINKIGSRMKNTFLCNKKSLRISCSMFTLPLFCIEHNVLKRRLFNEHLCTKDIVYSVLFIGQRFKPMIRCLNG